MYIRTERQEPLSTRKAMALVVILGHETRHVQDPQNPPRAISEFRSTISFITQQNFEIQPLTKRCHVISSQQGILTTTPILY